MAGTIKVVYENGVLRPLSEINLSEREEVDIIIINQAKDITSEEITSLAKNNQSFRFLEAPEEDVYTPEDGEPLWDESSKP